MKNILIALLAAATMVFVCFISLRFFGVTKDLAMNASSAVAAVFVAIHHALEKHENSEKQVPDTKGIVQIDYFGLPWHLMLIYGTILSYAVSSLGAGTSGALGGALRLKIEDSLIVSSVYMFVFTILSLFFVGRWIGVKCIRFGVGVVILIGCLHSAIGNSLNWAFASDRAFSLYFGDTPRSHWFLAVMIVGGSLIRVPIVAIGYWRGRHSRIGAYFQYLMKQIPMETRNTIVSLAYDEARSLKNNK